jgi:hypothetical protein
VSKFCVLFCLLLCVVFLRLAPKQEPNRSRRPVKRRNGRRQITLCRTVSHVAEPLPNNGSGRVTGPIPNPLPEPRRAGRTVVSKRSARHRKRRPAAASYETAAGTPPSSQGCLRQGSAFGFQETYSPRGGAKAGGRRAKEAQPLGVSPARPVTERGGRILSMMMITIVVNGLQLTVERTRRTDRRGEGAKEGDSIGFCGVACFGQSRGCRRFDP